jgi:hypothetical protein
MPVAARIRAEQARPAANDELYRMAETRTVAVLSGTPRATTTNNDRSMSLGPIIGLICGIVASSVAFGFALSLRRRINQIAGPVPEKDDDE